MDRIENKPKAAIIGADGNVFNLMGICSKALKKAGYSNESDEMLSRIQKSGSYNEALSIMCEYIQPVDQNYNSLDDMDYDDMDISI